MATDPTDPLDHVLQQIRELRLVTEVMSLTATICVVHPPPGIEPIPRSVTREVIPPWVPPEGLANTRVAHLLPTYRKARVTVVAAPEPEQKTPPPVYRRADPYQYDPEEYEPDERDSLDSWDSTWQEEASEPPTTH
jgi:hypothetical protein